MGTPGVVAGINPVPLHLRRAQQRAGASSRSDGSSKLSAIFRSLANRQIMLTCGVLLLMVAYVMSRQKSDGSAGRSIVVAPVPTASNDISEGDSGSTYDDAPSEDEVQEVEVPVYQEVVQEEPEVVQEEPARPPPFSISEACSSADTVDAPTFGILVLRPLHQQETIAALKEVTKGVGFDATEIIVFKDGAGQFEDAGDLRAASWSAALAGPNHFVVFGSHFFSEADAWNRMVLTARAKLLLLVRGVDVPFLRAGWLEKAATIFMAGPHLGVLGLFGGEVDGHIYGAGGLAVETADPVSQQPLIYVKSVMFGPLMVRRAIFQRVGTFSTAPECIGFPASAAGNSHRWPLRFEQEFCIRCWRKGFHVAFTSLALEETCAVSQCPSALATQMQTGIPKEPLVGRVQLGSDSLPVPFNSHVPQQEIVLKPGKAKAAGGKGKHGAQPAKGKSSAQQPATKGRKSASDNDRILPVPLSLSKSARAADDDDDDDDDDEYEYDEVADMEEGRRKATEAAMARAASAAAQGPKRVFAPTTTPSKSAPARGGGKAGGKQAGGGRRGGDGGDGGPDKGEDGEPDKGDDDDGGDDDGDAGNDDKDDEEEWEKDHSWMDADEQRMSHRRLLQMRPGPGVGGPMTTGQMRMGPGNGGQMRSGLGNGGQRLGGGIVSSSMSIRPSQGAGPATGPATIGPTHRFIDGVAVPVDRGASRKTPAGGWQGGADRGAGTVGVVGSRVNPGGMGTGEPNVGRYANPLAKPGELARVPMQVRRAGPQGESSGLGFADASVVSHVESATAAAARALVRQQAADEEATRHIQVEEDDAVVGDGTWDEEEEARVEEARRQRAAVHKRALEKQLALEAAATEAPSEVLQREYEMEEAARRDQVMTQAVNHKKGDKSSSSDHAYESIARNVQKLNEGLEIIEANAPLPGGTWCCASHIRHPMSYQHEGVGPSLVVCTYKPPHATGAVTAGFLVRSFHVHSDHLLVLMQRLALTHPDDEVVIINDSGMQHSEVHRAARQGPATVLAAHSNRIQDVRAYNRAARLVSADLLVFLDAEDLPPRAPQWFSRASLLFAAFPDLALLGGKRGYVDKKELSGSRLVIHPAVYGEWAHHIPYWAPADVGNFHFMFVDRVEFGPLIVRSSVFMSNPLLDHLSCPGTPGFGFDFEYSQRLWKYGLQVGLYSCGFEHISSGRHYVAGRADDNSRAAIAGVDAATAALVKRNREHLHGAYRQNARVKDPADLNNQALLRVAPQPMIKKTTKRVTPPHKLHLEEELETLALLGKDKQAWQTAQAAKEVRKELPRAINFRSQPSG